MVSVTFMGVMILMPFSPRFTCRPNFVCQARYPATRVASGRWEAMRTVLLKL